MFYGNFLFYQKQKLMGSIKSLNAVEKSLNKCLVLEDLSTLQLTKPFKMSRKLSRDNFFDLIKWNDLKKYSRDISWWCEFGHVVTDNEFEI